MGEPTTARYPTSSPNLSANRVNQKTFTVAGVHDAVVTTITTSATISGITAPCYLVNATTGEIIYAEGISGTQFTTCTRGADGTTGQPMATGQILHAALVANDLNQIIREILAIATQADNADPIKVQQYAMSAALRMQLKNNQIDHSVLVGLANDDHTQYHNDTRGDARYFTETESTILDNARRIQKPDGQIDHDKTYNFVANEHLDWTADQGATNIHSGNIPDLSSTYAVAAKGVTNGDSHDHNGGDGAQVNHTTLSNIGTNTHAQIDTFIGTKAQASGLASLDGSSLVVQNPANATATPTASKIVMAEGSGDINAGWLPDLSGTYAVAAKGVTNGDTHDLSGGGGAQINHTTLSNIGTNTHAQIDTFIGTKAAASGLASLDGSSKVVQDPANATATPTAGKIPIADGSGKLDGWVTPGSYALTVSDILMTRTFANRSVSGGTTTTTTSESTSYTLTVSDILTVQVFS